MNKCINVDELQEWVKNWFYKNKCYHPYAKSNTIPIKELYDILENMPAADVVEVKHGRWINDKFGSKCSSCGRYTPRIKDGFGSKCHYPDKYGEPLESLYCPNCGAKMDLKEELECLD